MPTPMPYEYFIPAMGLCAIGIALFMQINNDKAWDTLSGVGCFIVCFVLVVLLLPAIPFELGEPAAAQIQDVELFAKLLSWSILSFILAIIPYDYIADRCKWTFFDNFPLGIAVDIVLLILQFRMAIGGFTKIVELFQ